MPALVQLSPEKAGENQEKPHYAPGIRLFQQPYLAVMIIKVSYPASMGTPFLTSFFWHKKLTVMRQQLRLEV